MTVSTQRDIRVTIISRIWAYATAMLFISILLNGQEHNRKGFFLPATIVFGATISTIVVLRKLRDYRQDAVLPSEPLELLKQRVENLEAIAVRDVSQLSLAEPLLRRIEASHHANPTPHPSAAVETAQADPDVHGAWY